MNMLQCGIFGNLCYYKLMQSFDRIILGKQVKLHHKGGIKC